MSTWLSPTILRRRDEMMTRLSLLSETSAAQLERSARSAERPAGPPGTTYASEPSGPGPGDREPLLCWFRRRWELVRSHGDAERLLFEAELRREDIIKQRPNEAGAVNLAPRETTKERSRRIAEGYPGMAAWQVSLIESRDGGYVSTENVARERLAKGRDPETGHKLPEEARLETVEDKKTRARELAANGVTQQEIAQVFRVSQPTISRWLESNGRKAA
jgi:hypothetical protein